MITKRYFLLVAIAALFVAACQTGVKPVDGSGVTGVNPVDGNGVTGVYFLVEVNGTKIPGTVLHDGHQMQISSGTFSIDTDGTCLSTTVFTPPGGKAMTRKVRAKYVAEDSRLIMTWEGAGITEGTVEGDTFTMDNHGMIFEYTRKPS